MTITKPIEVVGRVCEQIGSLGRYAQITVRVEPAGSPAFVNEVKVPGFEDCFAEAAFRGMRSISQDYSWLTFRFTITDAKVQPVDSTELAFHIAGQEAAKQLFKQIYKRLTITAISPKTKIHVVDTQGALVQAEIGRMETSLLQGEYDVFFGNSRVPTRIDLQEDVTLREN